MAEYLKNNPIALRHCFLYEFLRVKSAEYAHLVISFKLGNDFIEKEEVQYWFDQFKQGKLDDNEEPKDEITDILRNDKLALRVCMLYDWLAFKKHQEDNEMCYYYYENRALPVLAMHEHFCKVIGDDVMGYREFEFWIYQFENGEFNLNFEQDKNKKIYELIDMPLDIMRNIVEYLDIVDRLSLERTSQSLRLFSQDQKLFHFDLSFNVFEDSACIILGSAHAISYNNEGNDCVVEFGDSRKVLRGVTCLKQALQDFNKLLEIPNLYLNQLGICFPRKDSDLLRCIEDGLKFSQQLHVEYLSLDTHYMKSFLNILPYLKPGYLTRISIDINSKEALNEEVVEMEQCKQAKYFHTGSTLYVGPLRHLCHFEEFTVRYPSLSEEDIRQMKEILLKSPDFKECCLDLQDSVSSITFMQTFDGAIKQWKDTFHYPIPNSTDYFEIFFGFRFIRITRKTKY